MEEGKSKDYKERMLVYDDRTTEKKKE